MRAFEWLPSLIAALSAFVLGGLWYSPLLFGKAWQREAGPAARRWLAVLGEVEADVAEVDSLGRHLAIQRQQRRGPGLCLRAAR